MMDALLWAVAPFCIAVVLTAAARRYAISQQLLDIPNARSAHVLPTPRGGGIGFAATFLCGLGIAGASGWIPFSLQVSLFGAGVLVLLVGFADDRFQLRARWRLAAHFLAACWALAWIERLPEITLSGIALNAGWLGQILAVLYLVWLLNLYNFMDGIDGIAGVETITVCAGAALLSAHVVAGGWTLPLLLAAATAGFLVWNFPRARIFMGDAGSGFLGITLGSMSIYYGSLDARLFWAWVILLGAFVADATLTLFVRVFRGAKFYEAHRSHAYQHAARKCGSHAVVTVGFGLVNLGWLLPIAWAVVAGWLEGIAGVLIAYAPLVIAAFYLGAGTPAYTDTAEGSH